MYFSKGVADFLGHEGSALLDQHGGVVSGARIENSLASSLTQSDGEERQDEAVEHALGCSKEGAHLAVEFFEFHPVNDLGDEAECDPNAKGGAGEEDAHGQELVPGLFSTEGWEPTDQRTAGRRSS